MCAAYVIVYAQSQNQAHNSTLRSHFEVTNEMYKRFSIANKTQNIWDYAFVSFQLRLCVKVCKCRFSSSVSHRLSLGSISILEFHSIFFSYLNTRDDSIQKQHQQHRNSSGNDECGWRARARQAKKKQKWTIF